MLSVANEARDVVNSSSFVDYKARSGHLRPLRSFFCSSPTSEERTILSGPILGRQFACPEPQSGQVLASQMKLKQDTRSGAASKDSIFLAVACRSGLASQAFHKSISSHVL